MWVIFAGATRLLSTEVIERQDEDLKSRLISCYCEKVEQEVLYEPSLLFIVTVS